MKFLKLSTLMLVACFFVIACSVSKPSNPDEMAVLACEFLKSGDVESVASLMTEKARVRFESYSESVPNFEKALQERYKSAQCDKLTIMPGTNGITSYSYYSMAFKLINKDGELYVYKLF